MFSLFFLCGFQIRDVGQEPCGRLSFLKEPKSTKGVPQTAVCNLNITLPTHKKVRSPCWNPPLFQSYHGVGMETKQNVVLWAVGALASSRRLLVSLLDGVPVLRPCSHTCLFHMPGSPCVFRSVLEDFSH